MTIPAIAPADRLEDDELSLIIDPVDEVLDIDIAEPAVDGVVKNVAPDDEIEVNDLWDDDERSEIDDDEAYTIVEPVQL